VNSITARKRSNIFFIVLFLVLIYSPIILVGTNRYFIPEFIIYFVLGIYIFLFRFNRIRLTGISKILIQFNILYLLVIFATILLKNGYNVEYVYQYRLILMSTVWFVFLDNYFSNISETGLKKTFGKSLFYLIGIPIIGIVSLFSDGFRELIYKIYVPAINIYDSVGYVFAGFREPGIFKDYYTASIFYFTLFFSVIYYRRYITLSKLNIIDFAFLLILILAEIVTGRTGLYASALLILFLILFNRKTFRFDSSIIILSPLIVFAFITTISKIDIVTINWAFESFIGSDLSTKSTVDGVNTVVTFWDYLINNLDILIIPLHPKSFGIALPFYSDSFYIQEIVRHGIWGFLVYMFFAYKLFFYFKRMKNNNLNILVGSLFLLNIKGGNVLFMERSSIFLWTAIFFMDKIYRLRNS